MLTPSAALIRESIDYTEDSSEQQRRAQWYSDQARRESNAFDPRELQTFLTNDIPKSSRRKSSSPRRESAKKKKSKVGKDDGSKSFKMVPIQVQQKPDIKFKRAKLQQIKSSTSALSTLMNSRTNAQIPVQVSSSANSAWHKTLSIRIFFEEAPKADMLLLQISCPMTIGEVIQLICNKVSERSDLRLIGDALQYELRYYDDDEIDYDLPPMSREVDIFDVGQEYMALCRRAAAKNKSMSIPLNKNNGSLQVGGKERNRGLTLTLNQDGAEMILKFIKIHVPGPTDTQTTLRLDDEHQKLRVRDLYSMLNRKIGGKPYTSAYFGLYYKESPYTAIDIAAFVHTLKTDRLYLLPRELDLRPGSDEYTDAMDYIQISMLKYKEFPVSKVGPNYKRKRTLGVDRQRIIKIVSDSPGMSLFQKEHLPINIHAVDGIQMLGAAREFEISYKHQSGQMRKQVYECKTSSDCEEFVNRIRYLMRYLQIRPK